MSLRMRDDGIDISCESFAVISKKVKMTKAMWKTALEEALREKGYAGMQNMTDNVKVCKFAKKKGFQLSDRQELRTLITEVNQQPAMFWFLRLVNGKDIAVCCPGKVVPGKYNHSVSFLETKPVNIVEV